MKLGAKERNLLLGLLGIIIAVCAWFFVASPMKEKTEALAAENETLKVKKDEYEAINAQRATYEDGINTLTAEREELLNSYASGMTREDEIMYWANLERENAGQLFTSDLVMSGWEEVYVEGYEEGEADEEGATQLHLYKAPVNYTYVATYDGVKNMVKYIFAQDDKKSIEGINVAFDDTTGNLEGTLDVNMYYMVGTGKDYKPYVIPSVPTGITNVFHSTNTEVVLEAEEAPSVAGEGEGEGGEGEDAEE